MFAVTIITAKTQVLSGFLRSYAANFIRFFGVPPRCTAPASPAVSWSQATVPGCDDGTLWERRPGSVLRRARPEPLLGIRLSAPSACTQYERLASRKYQELSHNSAPFRGLYRNRRTGEYGQARFHRRGLFSVVLVPKCHLAKGRNLFSASRRCRSKSGSSKLSIASVLLLRCFGAAIVAVAVGVGVEVAVGVGVEAVVGYRLTSDDIAR